MSEETTPAPEATPEATSPTTESQAAPKWDGDFDPERAAKLVENLRREKDTIKSTLDQVKAQLKEREDAEKSEAQKLAEAKEAAEKELSELRHQLTLNKVAKEHGIPDELVEFLGSGDEETLSERAKKLSEKLSAKAETGGTPEIPGKPAPKLTPGHAESATDGQLTRDDIKTMTPEQINKAMADGRLNSLLKNQ